MIVKFAAPLAGARGTIGGLVFSANGSGPYAKQWAPPSQPRSQPQTEQRSRLAKIPALWADISAAQKTDWADFAALTAQDLINSLAETYSISGYGWFTKCNTRLLFIGRSTIQDAPVIARPSSPTINDLLILRTGSSVNLAAGALATASSENPALPASNVFDGNIHTPWSTDPPQNIGWVAGELDAGAAAISAYQITAGDSPFEARAPKDWTFEAWNGASWDVVDTVTAEVSWAVNEQREFVVDIIQSATKFRLNVSAQNMGSGVMLFNQLEMFGDVDGTSIIVYPTGSFSSTDLVLFISQAASPTRQAFYSGFYSIIQTQTPGTNHQHFETELLDILGTIDTNRSFGARLYRQTSEGLRSAPATTFTVS